MFNKDLTYFPRQKLPSSKKTDKWAEQCVDAAESIVLTDSVIEVSAEILPPLDCMTLKLSSSPMDFTREEMYPFIFGET